MRGDGGESTRRVIAEICRRSKDPRLANRGAWERDAFAYALDDLRVILTLGGKLAIVIQSNGQRIARRKGVRVKLEL